MSSTMSMEYRGVVETLGPLVRATREHKGIRAADLAYRIGKDPSFLSKLERDLLKEIPEPAVLHALADALGIPEPRLLEALGYRVREEPVAPPRVGPDRAALIDAIERELTESDARVLMVTANALVDERDARTVRDAEAWVNSGAPLPAGPTTQ